MKNLKKLLCLVLAMIMALALCSTAFAEDEGGETYTTITIHDGADNANYDVYRILNLRASGDAYSYTMNTKYNAVMTAALTASGVANVPTGEGLTGSYLNKTIGAWTDEDYYGGGKMRDFANNLFAEIKKASLAPDEQITAPAKSIQVPQGYYLVVENLGAADTDEMRSLVMLDTHGDSNADIYAKSEHPTVDKMVDGAKSGVGYVGQVLTYTITANLTKYVDSYKEFNLYFTDTMGAGLTYRNDTAKVYYKATATSEPEDITAKATIEPNGQVLKVTVKNVHEFAGVGATSTVYCVYEAAINSNAISGMDPTGTLNNEVVLNYTNDPYWDSKTTPTEPTGEDKDNGDSDVKIITIKLLVDKVDIENAPLTGADFVLYRWDTDNKVWEAVDSTKIAAIVGTTTNFEFGGLGEGIYRLIESTVPVGHIPMDDKFFKIEAESERQGDGTTVLKTLVVTDATNAPVVQTVSSITTVNTEAEVNALTFGTTEMNPNMEAATVSTAVVNEAGHKLPSTGGQGTTMLYIAGGVMMLVALGGCYIYLRKRNTAEQ